MVDNRRNVVLRDKVTAPAESEGIIRREGRRRAAESLKRPRVRAISIAGFDRRVLKTNFTQRMLC